MNSSKATLSCLCIPTDLCREPLQAKMQPTLKCGQEQGDYICSLSEGVEFPKHIFGWTGNLTEIFLHQKGVSWVVFYFPIYIISNWKPFAIPASAPVIHTNNLGIQRIWQKLRSRAVPKLHPSVHSSTIHNSQEMEANWVSIDNG